MADKLILLPASYILKSEDCVDDSAHGEIPIKTVSTEILEIGRVEEQSDNPTLKILCYPSQKKNLETFYCDDKSRNQPMTFIECAATPKIDPDEKTIFYQKATISDKQDFSRQRVSCRKLKPKIIYRSPPDCEFACPGRGDLKIDISPSSEVEDCLSQITRRDDLDAHKISSSTSKRSLRKFKRRICPASCCQPIRQSIPKKICNDSLRLHAKSFVSGATFSPIEVCTARDRLDDQLQRPASEQMLQTEVARVESAKSDKASMCQRSAAAFRRACLIPGRISGDISRLPDPRELAIRYKEYIPVYQLERYEVCWSKRNGLQDECIPPLLKALLKKEEQQQRILNKCME